MLQRQSAKDPKWQRNIEAKLQGKVRDNNQCFQSNFDSSLYNFLRAFLPPFLIAYANGTNNRGNIFPIFATFGFCDSFLISDWSKSAATSPKRPFNPDVLNISDH